MLAVPTGDLQLTPVHCQLVGARARGAHEDDARQVPAGGPTPARGHHGRRDEGGDGEVGRGAAARPSATGPGSPGACHTAGHTAGDAFGEDAAQALFHQNAIVTHAGCSPRGSGRSRIGRAEERIPLRGPPDPRRTALDGAQFSVRPDSYRRVADD
ncbi:hypothetical protein Shyhy01_32880 [Streptomyces hygroscopicus subsp. hygroscopicus]|nr:hypothetical protein Shyhy01_32880 [Streptomyces hygroscopicus subsp. hygroscopicus]